MHDAWGDRQFQLFDTPVLLSLIYRLPYTRERERERVKTSGTLVGNLFFIRGGMLKLSEDTTSDLPLCKLAKKKKKNTTKTIHIYIYIYIITIYILYI